MLGFEENWRSFGSEMELENGFVGERGRFGCEE